MGYKRNAPDAPDTSDDDGSQPERGKETGASDPKLGHDQTEGQTNKTLSRDGEAHNLSREERKMTVIKCQREEMGQKETKSNRQIKKSNLTFNEYMKTRLLDSKILENIKPHSVYVAIMSENNLGRIPIICLEQERTNKNNFIGVKNEENGQEAKLLTVL